VSDFGELFGEWVAPLSVSTFAGDGWDGPTFAPPVELDDCMVEPVQRLVRTAEGNERMSAATVYVPPERGDLFALQSRVTLSGVEYTVIVRSGFDSFGLIDHVVVSLA
jgi:hypothetical protein